MYAGYQLFTTNQGVGGRVNQFGGDVEPGTFSLIEVATFCRGANPDSTMELVGAVASRDKKTGGDAYPRIHVEFFTAGPKTIGDNQGGWDEKRVGFVPAAGRPYGPGLPLFPLSIVGGIQYDSLFHIQRFSGNWWVNHNGHWLGYYPGSLFHLLGSKDATCEVAWYGEVYDPTPTQWTWTDMGSGLFANTGPGGASYVWGPFYFDSSGAAMYLGGSTFTYMTKMDTACYTLSPLLFDTHSAPYFFLGGPGGDAPGGGCK